MGRYSPKPPVEPRPTPSWSLLRRHSMIFPKLETLVLNTSTNPAVPMNQPVKPHETKAYKENIPPLIRMPNFWNEKRVHANNIPLLKIFVDSPLQQFNQPTLIKVPLQGICRPDCSEPRPRWNGEKAYPLLRLADTQNSFSYPSTITKLVPVPKGWPLKTSTKIPSDRPLRLLNIYLNDLAAPTSVQRSLVRVPVQPSNSKREQACSPVSHGVKTCALQTSSTSISENESKPNSTRSAMRPAVKETDKPRNATGQNVKVAENGVQFDYYLDTDDFLAEHDGVKHDQGDKFHHALVTTGDRHLSTKDERILKDLGAELNQWNLEAINHEERREVKLDPEGQTACADVATSPLRQDKSDPMESAHLNKVTGQDLTTMEKMESINPLVNSMRDVLDNSNDPLAQFTVLKTLIELDTRLAAVDNASLRLEEEYRENRELFDQIRDVDTKHVQRPAIDKFGTVKGTDRGHDRTDRTQVNRNINNSRSEDQKDGKESQSQTTSDIGVAHPPVRTVRVSSAQSNVSGERKTARRVPPRPLSAIRRQDQLRAERNEAFRAKRRQEAATFAKQVLAECGLNVAQSKVETMVAGPVIRVQHSEVGRGRVIVASPKASPAKKQSTSTKTSRTLTRGENSQPVQATRKSNTTHTTASIGPGTSTAMRTHDEDDDQQTTVISDWTLDSNVKRILYQNEAERFNLPVPAIKRAASNQESERDETIITPVSAMDEKT